MRNTIVWLASVGLAAAVIALKFYYFAWLDRLHKAKGAEVGPEDVSEVSGFAGGDGWDAGEAWKETKGKR